MTAEGRSDPKTGHTAGTVIRPRALTRPRIGLPRTPFLTDPGWRLLLINGAVLVSLLVLLFTLHTPSATWRVNQVAGETVVAQQRVTYADHLATAARKRQAMNQTGYVYRFDASAAQRSLQTARGFLTNAGHVIANTPSSPNRRGIIRRLLPPGFSAGALHQFYNVSAADFPVVRQRSLLLLSQAQTWQFAANQKQTPLLALLSAIPPAVTITQRSAIGEILTTFLTPTEIPDAAATRKRQVQAAASVPVQYATIYPGQVIIRRGDIVTPTVMEQLSALGLENRSLGWRDVLAAILFSAVIVAMLSWYLWAFHPAVVINARLLLLIDAAILISVTGARLLSGGHVLLPFMLPVAAAGTFAALLMAPEACIAVSLAIAVLAGWVVANSFELTSYYLLSSVAGVLAIRQLRQIKQFVFAGLYITAFALITALAFGLINHSYDFAAFQDYVLAAGVNGFVSSTLAIGGFAMLSGYFGVTTTLQLFELAQPNQPLLRRLTARAPGTYNHSLIVSNMVEQAAEAIGANAAVARVMALYHDVGKTANPHCFVENQLGIDNIHDQLEPDESARIIRGHVSQGLRLARQYRLPRQVLDAIAEHHGTMVLTYFLHKARQTAGDSGYVNPSTFTYPGPKPQTKETALLMLADGSESALRAAQDHSADSIRATVRRIFQERIEQQQLDECPLTLQDLERTQRAFCSVLNGLYHPRIEYPDSAELALQVPLPPPTTSTADGRAS
jgi:putative nucleotidyltransferase with HDIG domain